MSPDGDLVTRWDPDMPWQDTDDGAVVPEDVVASWTVMVPTGGEITEPVFNQVAPVIGTAIGLVAVQDALGSLTEMVDEVDFVTGYGAEIRERTTTDIHSMIRKVRHQLARIEARLPREL